MEIKTFESPQPAGGVNGALLSEELSVLDGFQGFGILEHGAGNVEVVLSATSQVGQAEVDAMVSLHDSSEKTVGQLILEQSACANEITCGRLASLRELPPSDALLVMTAREWRDMNTDTDTIDTPSEAFTYIDGKLVAAIVLVDGIPNAQPLTDELTHMFHAIMVSINTITCIS